MTRPWTRDGNGVESPSMLPVMLSGVDKSYDGRTKVLDAIDLRVEAGELFFLLGGSGCGKTTLLRLVAGFLHPERGTIRFGDKDVTGVPAEKRGIGMVFQNYALWPHLDVAGNVAFGLEMAGVAVDERRRRVREALDLVSLGDYGTRRIGELSGGQQQRVALARAIVTRPSVLLLDEPLSNLDAHLRTTMRAEIRRVCKASGVTALYVTHDQAEALSTADRIALIDGGRIAQVGTPRELYDRPRSEAVARFLGEANLLDRSGAALLVGDGGVPTGTRFCLRPERVRLVEQGAVATIEDGAFHGESARWRLRVGSLALTVVEMAPPVRKPGEIVHLTVAPTDLIALET